MECRWSAREWYQIGGYDKVIHLKHNVNLNVDKKCFSSYNMVNSNLRIPFVTQESLFVNENPVL